MSAAAIIHTPRDAEDWVPTEYLWSAEAFLRCVEEGIIAEDERVELIAGRIVTMAPMGGEHMWTVLRVQLLLNRQLDLEKYLVFGQSSLLLDENSLVDPDVLVVDSEACKPDTIPTPSMVQLLVDVSKSTLQRDLKQKLPLYAAAGIPEVWVVDLKNRCVHQFTEPLIGGQFAKVLIHQAGTGFASGSLPQLRLEVGEIFAD